MENTNPFTKEDRELLNKISDDVYTLSQNFQDIPEENPISKTCKTFVSSYNELCALVLD